MLRRFFCLFMAAFCLIVGVFPVHATASWADTVNDYVIVPWTDLVVDVLQSSDEIRDTMINIMGDSFRDIFDFWSDLFSSDSSEDEYIKLLPAVEVSSDGELIVPCFHVQFFTGFDSGCGHSIDSDNNLTFRPDSYNKDEFYYDCDNNSITFLKDFSGMVSIVWAFIPLEAGTYYNVW
ncbi:hypothetical protein, partial [Intestinimonas massiliensis (ex Afouda et al. 2020)]|uniref:hypothetical protein n=1 Tax=Intestinimonas massiliensis (ex Afouda et al. 2020) TaxID=1673721 RepID=UPI001030219B